MNSYRPKEIDTLSEESITGDIFVAGKKSGTSGWVRLSIKKIISYIDTKFSTADANSTARANAAKADAEEYTNKAVGSIERQIYLPELRLKTNNITVYFSHSPLSAEVLALKPQIWLFRYSKYTKKKGGNRWAHPPQNRKGTNWYGGENKSGLCPITEFPIDSPIFMRPEHWFVNVNAVIPQDEELVTAYNQTGSYDNYWLYKDIAVNRRKGFENLKSLQFKFAIVVENPDTVAPGENPYIIGPMSDIVLYKVSRFDATVIPPEKVKARFSLHTGAILSSFVQNKG